MKQNLTLTVMSLLSVVLMLCHIADDIRIGVSPAGLTNLIPIAVAVVWLYGTLTLAGRKSGYIIILVGSLLGTVIPVLHMSGPSGMVGPHLTSAGGVFFFVWTNLAIGVTCVYSALLAARGIWSQRSADRAVGASGTRG